jgi:putative PIN family toxin of toxin-antitoxin system
MGKKKEAAITVILDTNVLVSALIFKGELEKLVDLWKKDKIRPLFSKATFAEFRRVLDYPKFRLSAAEIAAIIQEDVLPFFDVVEPVKKKSGLCRDPEDDKFIALAMTAGADFIITGDDDLLSLRKVEKTDIVKPAVFRDMLQRI